MMEHPDEFNLILNEWYTQRGIGNKL
jgi:hypothetical protein